MSELYRKLIAAIPALWSYPFFCGIARVLVSEERRAPQGVPLEAAARHTSVEIVPTVHIEKEMEALP